MRRIASEVADHDGELEHPGDGLEGRALHLEAQMQHPIERGSDGLRQRDEESDGDREHQPAAPAGRFGARRRGRRALAIGPRHLSEQR